MSNNSRIFVIKNNGERELFSEDKIRRSATRVGVPPILQDELINHIKSKLYPNIRTSEILSEIKKYLRHANKPQYSTKYNLKHAIAKLGPSGYPFEKYLSALLSGQGFTTKTNVILKGKCVSHEIDVIATNNTSAFAIEAKFHTKQSVKTDVRTTLYVKARCDDIAAAWKKKPDILPWLMTNARFTSEAIKYAKCINLKLTSWDYPATESLRELVDRSGLHPITIFDSVSPSQIKTLLDNGIVTCTQLLSNKKKASSLLPASQFKKIITEASLVCQIT